MRRIQVEQANSALIRFETNYHLYGGGNHSTAYRDFVVEDVVCNRARKYAVFAVGNSDLPIRNVLLRRITVAEAQADTFLQQIEGWRFENVRIGGRLMPSRPELAPAGTPQLPLQQ